MKMKSWLYAVMLFLSALSTIETKGTTVNTDGTDVEVPLETTATYYELSASPPSSEWYFTSEFNYPSSNGWYRTSSTSYAARYERVDEGVTVVFVDAATGFSATISGKMYKQGGTDGGSLVRWGVKGIGSGSLNYTIDVIPESGIIALGNTADLTLKVNGNTAPSGMWKYSPNGGSYSSSSAAYTFPPSETSLDADEYTVSAARKSNASSPLASAEIKIVKIDKLQVKINGTFVDFTHTVKVLLGKTLYFKVLKTPETVVSWPQNKPTWSGTFGIAGNGETKSGSCKTASTSDTDYKTIISECGNSETGNALVCNVVLGAHSNVGAGAAVDDGHAWTTVRIFSSSGSTVQSYGLWPDDHPRTVDNGAGWDIRVGMEPMSTSHNRYYLLTPSQKNTLNTELAANVTWAFTHNCSSWASDTIYSVTGEDVDADDEWLLGVETPREFGQSIDALEANEPTSSGSPLGNEEMEGEGSSSSF